MDLKPLFDSLYDKLILRDFTAKIVPGLILLGVGFFIGAERDFWDYALIRNVSALTVLATLGAAWVTSFALQSCGELLRISCNRHLIEYYPKGFKSDREWYLFHYTNTKDIPDARRRAIERIVVIKEACGNGAASLLVSTLLYVIHILIPGNGNESVDIIGSIPIVLLDMFLIVFLLRMHHVHVQRQFELTEVLSEVEARPGSQPSSAVDSQGRGK